MVRQVHAAHILVKSEAQAKDLLKKLNNGERFYELAKNYSSCPSGRTVATWGWFGKGQMVPEFEKSAFEGAEGQVVGPVRTQFGYHLIKILGKK